MRIFAIATTLCLGLLSVFTPIATQAAVISFDGVTGVAEASPTNILVSNCGGSDFCMTPLIFSNAGTTVTVTASTSTASNLMDLVPWYDIAPASLGGIGAATTAEVAADTRSADNALATEFIHVGFSKIVEVTGWWLNGNHVSGTTAGLIDTIKNDSGAGSASGFIAMGDGISFVDLSTASSAIVTGTGFFFYADGPYYLAGIEYQAQAVPEPATLILLGLALFGIAATSRRRLTIAS